METGLLNFRDEERFSSVCKNTDFERDNSIFGGPISDYELDSFSIRNLSWDQSFNIKEIKIESGMNEDYERTFREWNQHLKEFDSELKCDGNLIPDLIDVDHVCINPVDYNDAGLKINFKEEPCIKEEFPGEENLYIPSPEVPLVIKKESVEPLPEVPLVFIKKEPVETESEPLKPTVDSSPAVEAGDLKSLLEQFEAASKPQKPPKKASRSNFKPSPTIVNKSIKDALPKEVIERIRESCKKRKNACSNNLVKAELEEQPKENTNGISVSNTVALDHNYCCRGECAGSRKDSGLESGEISDSPAASPGLSVPIKREDSDSCLTLPQKEDVSAAHTDGDKKKKKLKLEEYRERRKNMKPLSPPKINRPSLKIVVTQKIEPTKNQPVDEKPSMVSVEVQTEVGEVKKQEKIDEELQKKKEMWLDNMKRTYRPRYSSTSSASSCDSRSRSKRRPHSKRYSGRSKGDSWSRSRSRSFSSSSNSSSLSGRSHSRSRSRSSNKRRRHSFCRNKNRKYSGREISRRRERSPIDKAKQIEERRVVYVGQIEEGISKQKLRERFQKFGQIVAISLHFRERGDNYGFVTFKYPSDAYEAVEHGNDYGLEPRYDICFGGRRAFCKQRYSDLDNVTTQQSYIPYSPVQPPSVVRAANSFDLLLREAQENLRKRSTV